LVPDNAGTTAPAGSERTECVASVPEPTRPAATYCELISQARLGPRFEVFAKILQEKAVIEWSR
jgi:hypothetical protein